MTKDEYLENMNLTCEVDLRVKPYFEDLITVLYDENHFDMNTIIYKICNLKVEYKKLKNTSGRYAENVIILNEDDIERVYGDKSEQKLVQTFIHEFIHYITNSGLVGKWNLKVKGNKKSKIYYNHGLNEALTEIYAEKLNSRIYKYGDYIKSKVYKPITDMTKFLLEVGFFDKKLLWESFYKGDLKVYNEYLKYKKDFILERFIWRFDDVYNELNSMKEINLEDKKYVKAARQFQSYIFGNLIERKIKIPEDKIEIYNRLLLVEDKKGLENINSKIEKGLKNLKTIGVLTSGGDAPGMNAAIRSVVRSALDLGFKVYGVDRGYEGLMAGDVEEMDSKSVSDVIFRGGTLLQTARSMQFMTKEGQQEAIDTCKKYEFDALVVIGGDGSYRGAKELSEQGVNVIGLPGTIDLDIGCTDYTIGFDTAVNTAMDAIEKIRDTSSSHNRCSVIEVMGRNAGYIALWCGISSGAEIVLIPERKDISKDDIVEKVLENKHKGKKHEIIIVAEGFGDSDELTKYIEEKTGITTRRTVLGYLQRGGEPTAVDRIHASMMGKKAVDLIKDEKYNKVVSFKCGEYVDIDIEKALDITKDIDEYMYDLSKILAH